MHQLRTGKYERDHSGKFRYVELESNQVLQILLLPGLLAVAPINRSVPAPEEQTESVFACVLGLAPVFSQARELRDGDG
ncbi:hypothetical protein BTVI_03626 [Pitangus sulphuratus]|nr:hypothetical protein BTVI_03626 [Pitangus sulphuratus]